MTRLRLAVFAALALAACDGVVSVIEDSGVLDAGVVDAGLADAGADDAGLLDAGLDDAGLPDAGGPDAGMSAPRVVCATPVQDGVDTSAWPETFVGTVAQGCADDADAGTATRPLCNPHLAMDRITSAGHVVTFLDGVYRLAEFPLSNGDRGKLGIPNVNATASDFVVLRAASGAKPVFLGSVRVSDGWTLHSTSPRVWRRSVSTLTRDVTALYQVVDGASAQFTRARRFRHVMEFRSGIRSHVAVSSLADGAPGTLEASMTELGTTRDFTWTKADASGAGCSGANTDCFIYLRADDVAFDPSAVEFELPQWPAIGGTGSYAVIDGLHTRFTQCAYQNCSLQFEGVRNALIQNSSFGHVSNSDDNSYALGLWFSNGSVVRRNVAFDSAYWGGVPNSKGITLMVSGDVAPNWLCENEIFNIPGLSGVGSKGGVSNLYVVGNWIHDCYVGIESTHERAQGGTLYAGGNWVVAQNVFERNGVGVLLTRNGHFEPQVGDVVVNNLFVGNTSGVQLTSTTPPDSRVHDNIFVRAANGPTCTASSQCDGAIYFANNAGEVRDFEYQFNPPLSFRTSHNLFFGYAFPHGATRNWTANYVNRSLTQFQTDFAAFGAEVGSLEADPMLDAQHRPLPGSPVLGAGIDGGNIGVWP